jgi:LPXTG-site transpeptidase (sortase) family protein
MIEQHNHTKLHDKNEVIYPKPKRSLGMRILFRAIEVIVIAAISITLAYLIVNWPALYTKYSFWSKNRNSNNQVGGLPEIPDIEREGSWIIIPKINVDAPIIWSTSVDNMMADLDNGVAHYPSTAMPGESGNCALTGHSSNYWWSQGKYNTVFTLLDKLVPGDQTVIMKDGKKYVYQVTGSEIVEPTHVSVLDPTPSPTLTLITCTPVGTNLRRLIVYSKQTEPKPKKTNKKTTQPSSDVKILPVR